MVVGAFWLNNCQFTELLMHFSLLLNINKNLYTVIRLTASSILQQGKEKTHVCALVARSHVQ